MAIITSLFLLAGCAAGNAETQPSALKRSAGTASSTAGDKENTAKDSQEDITMEFQDTYYKYKTEPGALDMDEIVKIILRDKAGDEALETGEIQADGSSAKGGEIVIDGVTHTWIETTSFGMIYTTDKVVGGADFETARKVADDFVEALGWDYIVEEPQTDGSTFNGSYSFSYAFQYNGVELMGDRPIYLSQNSNDDSFLTGAFVTVEVNADGISGAIISPMPEIGEATASYTSADFISPEEALEIAGRSNENITIREIEILYMPFQETNGAQVLIPAYNVKGSKDSDDDEGKWEILIDAVTGYIYSNWSWH